MLLFCDQIMPTVSFYILESPNIQDYFKTIVQLTLKAFEAEHQILIHSNHPNILKPIDDYLWSFSTTSFIPHVLANNDNDIDEIDPIILASFEPTQTTKDLLIQLGDNIPNNFQAYHRIIEVLYSEPTNLVKGRERFKFYRQNGIEPTTVKL